MQEQAGPRIQLNTRLLPVLVLSLLVMQLLDPYRGWMILLVGLGGAWAVAYLWARSLAGGLSLTREMRFGWAQVGDRLQERFTVTNRGWAPAVWIEIIDHSTMPDYRAGRVTGVGGGAENRWVSEGRCTRRGLFTLGPTSLQTGDPLGFYTVRVHHPACADIMVTPPVVPLPSIQVAPGGRAEEGRSRPFALERTVISAGVRDFQPGDSPRWIHWPTTARHDRLYVRLFDNLPSGNWWILLDMNRSAQVGEGRDSTGEHGIILTASLASQALRAGRQVGLVASGAELTWYPLGSGETQLQRILRALAVLEPGERPLDDLLARMPPDFGRLSSLVLITPDVQGGWLPSLLPLLRRGIVPTVLLLDPLSFGGTRSAAGVLPVLSEAGVAHTVVTRELLDRPEARPGRQGRWEWHVSATGRVVPIRRPDDMTWKKLS